MKNPESALAFLLIVESMQHRERVVFRASNKLCEKYGQEVNIEVYKTRLPYDETKFNVTINLVDTNGDLLKNQEGKPATKARNQHLFNPEYTELVYGMVNPKFITKNRKFENAEIPIKPIPIKPEGYIPGRRGRKPNLNKVIPIKPNKNLDTLKRLISMDEISEGKFEEKNPVVVMAETVKAGRRKKPEIVTEVSEKVGAEVSKPEVKRTRKTKEMTELEAHFAERAGK